MVFILEFPRFLDKRNKLKGNCTVVENRKYAIATVNSVDVKTVNTALAEPSPALYLCLRS